MKEVTGGKSVEPTAALGNPGKYRDTLDGNAGLKQAPDEKTTSDGGSNLETLRQGNKPKPEAVEEVKFLTQTAATKHSQHGNAPAKVASNNFS